MASIYQKNLRLLCAVGVISILCLTGCSQTMNSGPGISSTLKHPEQEFQNQTHRPPTSKTLFTMAEIFAAQGRDSECEFVLKRIIQEYPMYIPAYNSLAELQMQKGQINTAIETIYHAFDVNSDDPVLLNNLGVCWIVHGDYEKALDSFTKAAGAMPENVRYRTNMAMALGLMDRYDESLSLFRLVMPEEQATHNLNILKQAGKNPNPESAWQ
jgi:Flp pilus assembly protein TadD